MLFGIPVFVLFCLINPSKENLLEESEINEENEEILYYLYYAQNSSVFYEIQLFEDEELFHNEYFNLSQPTKFLIHGWTHSKDTPWLMEMREVMASTKKWNIIVVDWSSMSHNSYVKSREKTKLVGENLGNFLAFMITHSLTHVPDVHMIGHSFGAHIAGFAGQYIKENFNQAIGRITALDPAAPGFEYGNKTYSRKERIDDEDAYFVDVIHSNGRILGMLNPVGHIDFYPNGGVTQPGCSTYSCSHIRACEFWTASVVHPDAYRAYRYKSWIEYLNQRVHQGESVSMGIKANRSNPWGTYFLETASDIPYVHYKTKLIHSL